MIGQFALPVPVPGMLSIEGRQLFDPLLPDPVVIGILVGVGRNR